MKEDATPLLLDFCFNGWGMKFAANYDNQINNELYFHHPVLKGEYVFCRNFILEGGSIESDGKGSLLTTEQCLLAKNRNEMNRQEVEDFLKETFNLKQVLWLKHGYLAGDDTDSHVDTLARFCPDDTIVYVKCTNEKDEHYKELAMMEEELKRSVLWTAGHTVCFRYLWQVLFMMRNIIACRNLCQFSDNE